MTQLFDELRQQPEALRKMVCYYKETNLLSEVISCALNRRWILTGMGASFHAASICAYHLNSLGIDAAAIETVDLLNYHDSLCKNKNLIMYLSQSGASGEVQPLLDSISSDVDLIGITNNVNSPLGKNSRWTLSLEAQNESLIASKTYINSLALLWLIARKAARIDDGSEWITLLNLADRMESTLEQQNQIKSMWMEQIGECAPWIFLGHGIHAITARQAAMILGEWPKLPVLHAGIGAFRHGFIEMVKPDMAAVIFTSNGFNSVSVYDLAHELSEYGLKVLLVENGSCGTSGGNLPPDKFLSPILDIIPVQLLADEMAVRLKIPSGFRHLSKVVTKL